MKVQQDCGGRCHWSLLRCGAWRWTSLERVTKEVGKVFIDTEDTGPEKRKAHYQQSRLGIILISLLYILR